MEAETTGEPGGLDEGQRLGGDALPSKPPDVACTLETDQIVGEAGNVESHVEGMN